MNFPYKRFFVGMICSFFITAMVEHTHGQILSVPAAGFDEALTPGAKDPLSADHTSELSDEEIQYRIQRRLKVSPYENGEITVRVGQGETILSGFVENQDALVDVVEIAFDAGATNVNNQLRIKNQDLPWKKMTDQELKEAVEEELYWSPFVNSVPIRVEARNGIVTLSGRVENRGEIVDAVANAYEAGAKNVRIHLWIDPTLD
ncbi:BON domain-containing protein [Candidatus Nitrospira allomarina]|jgi:osmotically-inducible protein OsmY|uniref:BON domain-containing protein n=1 Tax=Candidatus Nitrospira allomarina TaxID=3020900 RepID=A0AA96GF85_9BACT|nr:BON domain-containing protein [Candidatus Nitrospira allomarina]WNM56681.1 BON domain-containing protein [Candidatus Nitrospira allomarina]